LKAKIDKKENERKLRFHNDQLKADDDFAEAAEEIIDEEELVLLRQMKDLKKEYRDHFSQLKSLKQDHEDAQS
jgi:adenosyl cobinamide kinase/adenosyl cobinamide phosphate guanylyltransferase